MIGYTNDLTPDTYHIVAHRRSGSGRIDWSAYPAIRVFYQTTLNAEQYEDVVRIIETANAATRRADTICYATKENQDAARQLAADPEVEVILVIGGSHSANTRHLWEIYLHPEDRLPDPGRRRHRPLVARRHRLRRRHRRRFDPRLRHRRGRGPTHGSRQLTGGTSIYLEGGGSRFSQLPGPLSRDDVAWPALGR